MPALSTPVARVTAYVPPEVAERIGQLATHRQVSVAAVTRDLIRRGLAALDGEAANG